jgi:hypothetical protein
METSIETKELSAAEILKDIKAKRNNFDKRKPLKGRKWYFATGQNIKEFNAHYPHNTIYEFHYFIISKYILQEVLINLLKEDTVNLTRVSDFLKNKTAPSYLFNYCFDFK